VKDCKHLEFGNPSSHTFLSSALFVTTGYLFYRHYTHKWKLKQSLLQVLGFMNAAFAGIYLIGFSRVFKGVHTYN